jgi:hypothetical protein
METDSVYHGPWNSESARDEPTRGAHVVHLPKEMGENPE